MGAEKGRLFVISGPSGAGKSTVISKALDGLTNICFSVSVTTREPRKGEIDGKDYFFIDKEKFHRMVENDELLEHASYVDNCYGTPRSYVENMLSNGTSVILDIEVQGAKQVKEKMPEAIMVFVIPPSLVELENRLRNRKTDSEERIRARLERAREEYSEANFYDYIVINNDVSVAAEEFKSVVISEKCRAVNRKHYLENK